MDRYNLLQMLWKEQDSAYDLMAEYDSLPHSYGNAILYQTEAYIIREIGTHPNITTTRLAEKFGKTTSACSQTVKKLLSKGLVSQIQNEKNKRIYNLTLTEAGQYIYNAHVEFTKLCQKSTFDLLNEFTDEELAIHIKVQQALNKAYKEDVIRSRE